MDKDLLQHYESLRAAAFNIYDLKDAGKYITDKTYLDGQRFSFADYPFQEAFLSDTSRNICSMKPAQVGMSEIVARYCLALCRIIPMFTSIYVAPFATDAAQFMNTRIKRIIEESPDLKAALDRAQDNTEIKGISTGLLYATGASGTTAGLSIPADMLIFDELDKANPDIIGRYSSRLRASKYKLTRKLSTPTLKGRGIELACQTTQRHHFVCKCNHCNEVFIPDYESQVVIPGFDGKKKEITKELLPRIRWREAVLLCPRCKLVPDLNFEHRFWLVENPSEDFDGDVSYIISPFDAPKVHTAASITKEITTYNTYGEAQNQVLGKVSTDVEDQLTADDVEGCKALFPLHSSNLHAMGCDMGLTCHIVIGRVSSDGILLIVHRERIPMTEFEDRRITLAREYRVLVTVVDMYPYTDMVYRMARTDKNLYGAIYSVTKGAPAFALKKVEEDKIEGKLPQNQVLINRTLVFDELMHDIKKKKLIWAATGDHTDATYVAHILDMKRVQIFDKHNELHYVWEKSKAAVDHFHHANLYLKVAWGLMATASRDVPLNIPFLKKFKVVQQLPPN